MAISKVTVHGTADTAGELEAAFKRIEDELSAFIGDKEPQDEDEKRWGIDDHRDKDGNVLYVMSDLKLVPKLNEFVRTPDGETMVSYVVGHATYTVWTG